jgi:hypothetical protein
MSRAIPLRVNVKQFFAKAAFSDGQKKEGADFIPRPQFRLHYCAV